MIRGIIAIENQNIILKDNKDNKVIINNTSFIECDEVEFNPDTKETTLIKRYHNIISGVLHTSSKISYGHVKDYILKKFTPFNYNLPTFFVKTKKQYQANDIYVQIKYDKYENGVHYGSVLKYIGDVNDDINTEYDFIKTLLHGNWMSNKKLLQPIIDLTPDRTDLTKLDVYSIDPIGCKDIDDALSIVFFEDYIQVGIHIADVSSYFDQDSLLDNEIRTRCETIYYDDKRIDMIPDYISLEQCSLIQNTNKRAYSLLINFTPLGDVIDFSFKKSIIKVKKNMSYEEAQDNEDIKNLYQFGILLKEKDYIKYDFTNRTYDTHIMVEVYMILANIIAGQYLYSKCKDKAILRRHTLQDKEDITYEDIDEEILQKSNLIKQQRAEYVIDNENTTHEGLNKKYYTHFTSPIRRYIDIYIHRLIFNQEIEPLSFGQVNYINVIKKNNQRILQRYDIIKYFSDKTDNIIDITGHIIDIDNNVLKIYIKSMDIIISTMIISDRVEHLFEIEREKDQITIKYEDKVFIFKIFQEIRGKMIYLNKQMKRIQLKITEPNISHIFLQDI